MKTGTFKMSKIKSFGDFKKVWESMRECTKEEEQRVREIISKIKS